MSSINRSSLAFLSILFSLWGGIISAQENYVEGYIIKSGNDTVKGLIDYKDWYFNPESILFKPNLHAAAVVYKPLEILEFGVADEIYISAVVDIDTSSIELEDLEKIPVSLMTTDTAFLRVMFRGSRNLYQYKLKHDREFYYIDPDDQLMLLKYNLYTKTENYTKYKKQRLHRSINCLFV